MKIVGLVATLLLPGTANAFCGTYIGGPDDALFNDASQIVIAREGNRSTLTLVNDYQGDLKEFAMVIPVPKILNEGDVRVVGGDLVAEAARFSAPREVAYTCEDFASRNFGGGGMSLGCHTDYTMMKAEPPMATEDTSTVVVESEFTVGIYDIVVLSAEESGDLMSWLGSNGYAVDETAEELLGEYIDSGAFFFAAKVNLGDQLVDGEDRPTWLEPLQFTYESDAFSLPIRLGTLNSRGQQDLLIYTLTPYNSGSVGISNFPEVQLPKDCMLGLGADMSETYEASFSAAVDAVGGTGWALEHSWTPYHCDPCTGPTLEEPVLTGLGYTGTDPWFSRIHVRYTSDIQQDLMLYGSGITQSSQSRFIQFNAALTQSFPMCDPDALQPFEGFEQCANAPVAQSAQVSLAPIAWLGSLSLVAFGLVRRRRLRG